MENEFLKNQLQNVRNHLTTLAGNIDNTLLIYNDITRSRNRAATRRNLNNLFNELRNLNPYTTNINNSTNLSNPSDLNNSTNLNSTGNINNIRPSSNLFNYPDLIEVTLMDNGRRVVNNNNMEDVQVYPSLRTLRESSSVCNYGDLATEQETCSICRENFTDSCIVRKLGGCEHIFHLNCIDTWFETNIRCPLCRMDLRETEEQEELE